MFYTAIQDNNIMFPKDLCLANFSHILGHLKIFVSQNIVFGPLKIFFYAKTPNFHVHEKSDNRLKVIQ